MLSLYTVAVLCLSLMDATYVGFKTYDLLKLPLNLHNHVSLVYKGIIYIMGGITDNDYPSNAIYKSKHVVNTPVNSENNTFIQIDTINITLKKNLKYKLKYIHSYIYFIWKNLIIKKNKKK
eukprot:392879_1